VPISRDAEEAHYWARPCNGFVFPTWLLEALLAAGAPVAAHWIADRQSAPSLLRYGRERQPLEFLSEIAAGRCFFAIEMSEPDSGSDLASVRTWPDFGS